jgi:hypothetical protein
MTVRLPDSEVQKRAAMKALRTGVRLKYSLMADAELNERLPEFEQRINDALLDEEPLELTVGRIIDEV